MRKYRLDISKSDIYSPIALTVEIYAYDLLDAVETAQKIAEGRYFMLTPITQPATPQTPNE